MATASSTTSSAATSAGEDSARGGMLACVGEGARAIQGQISITKLTQMARVLKQSNAAERANKADGARASGFDELYAFTHFQARTF